MFTTIAMTRGALALLLTSAVVGAAQAQTVPSGAIRSAYCTGGLFTLSQGAATFHVALDDINAEPGVFAVMRFINQYGTVVKSKTVSIAPGRSATLEYRGSGLYRAQAETFESPGSINLNDRRTVVAALELWQSVSLPNGTDSFRLIGPGPWVPCRRVDPQ